MSKYKVISTAWIDSASEVEFEIENCLTIQSDMGIYTCENSLLVLVLWGYERLSGKYIQTLAEKNIIIIDFNEEYKRISEIYDQGIEGLKIIGWNSYEVACLLRWLVLEAYGAEVFCHIDLDLFLNIAIDELDPVLDNRSGTYGSPCFAFFNSKAEFDKVLCHVKAFLLNPVGYQERYKTRVHYRNYIGSDQDLFYVISKETEDLIEHNPFSDTKYSIFVNPLFIPPVQNGVDLDVRVTGADGYLNGKKVMFWHLQRNFVNYYADHMIFESFSNGWEGKYLPISRSLPFLQMNPTAETFAFHALRATSISVLQSRLREEGVSFEKLKNFTGVRNSHFYFRYFVARELVLENRSNGVFSVGSWHQKYE